MAGIELVRLGAHPLVLLAQLLPAVKGLLDRLQQGLQIGRNDPVASGGARCPSALGVRAGCAD